MSKQPRFAPLGRTKAKRLRGSTTDPRPKSRPPGWQPSLEIEAQRKVYRIQEALSRAGYTDLAPLLSMDRKSVGIYRTKQGAPADGYTMPINGVETYFPRYEWQLVCSAPVGKVDLELPAWELAYQTLIGETSS